VKMCHFIFSVAYGTKMKYTRHRAITLMMEAVSTSETSVDNYFTRQYIPGDNSELERMMWRGQTDCCKTDVSDDRRTGSALEGWRPPLLQWRPRFICQAVWTTASIPRKITAVTSFIFPTSRSIIGGISLTPRFELV